MILRIVLYWLFAAASLLAVAYIVPGISIDAPVTALWAGLAVGVINTLVRPVLVIITLPLSIFTFGIFYFMLNGFLFWAASRMVDGFSVQGFWAAIFGAILYSVMMWALGKAFLGSLRPRRV